MTSCSYVPTELGRVVFTQDDDFLVLADQWNSKGRHFAGIVYAHQLRVTVGQIIAELQLIVEAVTWKKSATQ